MRPNVHHLILNFFYREERGRGADFEEIIFQLDAWYFIASEFMKIFLTLVQVKTQDTECSPFLGSAADSIFITFGYFELLLI